MTESVVNFYPNKKIKTEVSLAEMVTTDSTGRKSFYVKPDDNETIKKIEEVKGIVFSELKYFNVILTNACNLSCSYCFEQHNKDYGRFDIPKLKKLYDFLATCNNDDGRLFQFFGGEPLAQKKLILEFCDTFKEELDANKNSVRVSIVTNGLLLTPEFVKEYFDYDFTQIVISLDTDDAEHDQREIGQDGIDHIIDMVKLIPWEKKRDHQVCIRSTINEESVARQPGFIDRLYAHGIRNLIIHPLILSRLGGIIEWQEENWNKVHQDILNALAKYPDFKITWAEGVGSKGESNCMVGSDMITVDPSGDFSGCYFFTNGKEQFGHTILGNILNDQIYVDRYKAFQQTYLNALTMHEECKTCNLQGYCYQCPAGNMATGGVPFRPDGMCKKIVKLFLDLRTDLARKQFMTKFKNIEESYAQEGEIVLNRAMIHLMHKKLNNKYIEIPVLAAFEKLPNYKRVLKYFERKLDADNALTYTDITDLVNQIDKETEEVSAYDFYVYYCNKFDYPITVEYTRKNNQVEENYFITLLHLLILDNAQFARKQLEEHSTSRIFKL